MGLAHSRMSPRDSRIHRLFVQPARSARVALSPDFCLFLSWQTIGTQELSQYTHLMRDPAAL